MRLFLSVQEFKKQTEKIRELKQGIETEREISAKVIAEQAGAINLYRADIIRLRKALHEVYPFIAGRCMQLYDAGEESAGDKWNDLCILIRQTERETVYE